MQSSLQASNCLWISLFSGAYLGISGNEFKYLKGVVWLRSIGKSFSHDLSEYGDSSKGRYRDARERGTGGMQSSCL